MRACSALGEPAFGAAADCPARSTRPALTAATAAALKQWNFILDPFFYTASAPNSGARVQHARDDQPAARCRSRPFDLRRPNRPISVALCPVRLAALSSSLVEV